MSEGAGIVAAKIKRGKFISRFLLKHVFIQQPGDNKGGPGIRVENHQRVLAVLIYLALLVSVFMKNLFYLMFVSATLSAISRYLMLPKSHTSVRKMRYSQFIGAGYKELTLFGGIERCVVSNMGLVTKVNGKKSGELERLQQTLIDDIEYVQRRFPKQFDRELQTSKSALKFVSKLLEQMKPVTSV